MRQSNVLRKVGNVQAKQVPTSAELMRAASLRLAKYAVRSLHTELMLFPKPGLVSAVDSGSHHDMDAKTFMRSLFSLRHFFKRIAQAGWRRSSFASLKYLGITAEREMLAATGGINTHRGAIFCLGLLVAATAACMARGQSLSLPAIRTSLLEHWQLGLQQHTSFSKSSKVLSHGKLVAQNYAVTGAREEAALGFPAVFELGMPRLEHNLATGLADELALLDVFFCLMAEIQDTNVIYRGGLAGAALVKQEAQQFLAMGGCHHPHWKQLALASHQKLVAARLSPGGAADLLAACRYLQLVQECSN